MDEPGENGPAPTLYDSLVGMLMDPATTFERIRRQPVVFVPCVLLVLIAATSTYLITEGIGFENLVRRQIDKSPFAAGLSGAEKEAAIEQALESRASRSMVYLGPIFFPVALLAVAGLLTLILMVLGHSPGFRRLFSVTAHSFLAYSIVLYPTALAVVYLAQDPALIDPQNVVQSHLGALVDEQESPVLFTLAASVDALTFYNLFLLALGVSVMCGRRAGFGTGLGSVLVLWSLWVIAKTGLALLTG